MLQVVGNVILNRDRVGEIKVLPDNEEELAEI
jgi:hypothetical protein